MFRGASLATLDLTDRFGSDTDTLREILLGQIKLTAMLTDTLAEEHIILHGLTSPGRAAIFVRVCVRFIVRICPSFVVSLVM